MNSMRNWLVAIGAAGALSLDCARSAPPAPPTAKPATVPAAATNAAPPAPAGKAAPAATPKSTPAAPPATAPAANSAAQTVDRDDRRFLQSVAAEEETEVALAQLAADRSDDPRIRNFAQDLGRDHTALGLQIATLAQTRSIPVENDLVGDRTYRGLSHQNASHFDAKFLKTIIERRQRDIQRYEDEIQVAKDPEVRSFATSHLSQLREQLATAEKLQ